jgi:hypothetical protein
MTIGAKQRNNTLKITAPKNYRTAGIAPRRTEDVAAAKLSKTCYVRRQSH